MRGHLVRLLSAKEFHNDSGRLKEFSKRVRSEGLISKVQTQSEAASNQLNWKFSVALCPV